MTANAEPIQDVAHLGHVELLTPKPEESLHYFTELLGMAEVHRQGGSVYLRAYGDYATTTLKLTEAATSGVGHLAWRCVSPQALERRAAAIEETGLGIGWFEGDYGHGRCYRFHDPDGHAMEVYYEETPYRAPEAMRSTLKNMPMKVPSYGVPVRKTDHVALMGREVAPNREFMIDVMGLKLREQVIYENGTKEIGSWMSASQVHHEVVYVRDPEGKNGRLHHYSLFVESPDAVIRAATLFRENDVYIEAGPSKHNNSQAFYLYSYEPGGNRVEVYASGFFVLAPDFEPIVWDETARGTGVYWGAPLPESFYEYATPPA